MYMAFYSETMSLSQITDYLLRVVQPQLQAVPGVAKAQLIGNKTFAMRVWLDPERMAALGVTATDVEDVLRRNNYLAGIGKLKDRYFAVDLSATTDVSEVEDFRNLVVISDGHPGASARRRGRGARARRTTRPPPSTRASRPSSSASSRPRARTPCRWPGGCRT